MNLIFWQIVSLIPTLEPLWALVRGITRFFTHVVGEGIHQVDLVGMFGGLNTFSLSLSWLPYDPKTGQLTVGWEFQILGAGLLGFLTALVFQTIRHRKKTVSYRIQIQTSKNQVQELSRQSAELKNQLRTYSQAQDIAQIGVWESDLQSGKLTWSNPIETIFGFEPGTFPGTREAFYETVHPEDRPLVREAVNRCIQTGEAYAIKHRIVLPNRTIRWIEEQGGIQRDAAGKAVTLYGIVKDITQQQLAKEEVWLFKTISEQANYGSLILDLDGSILYANNAFAQLLDQPTDAILGQSIFDLDETDRDEDSTPLFDYLYDRGELQSEEMIFRRSDGTTFPALFNATAVTNEKGMRIYYAATAIDISDYKQAEEGLRASEQFLQSIIDSLFSSIAVLDHHGVILTVNRAWKRFADENENHDPYYGIGKNYLRVCETAIDPDTQNEPVVAQKLRQVLEGNLDQFTLEYTCHSPDKKRWFLMGVTRGSQDPLRIVVSHSDITQLKMTEEALVQARDEAEAANHAKSNFLANMSHEIRTPLNAILGFCQILQRESTLNPKQQNYLDTIIRSGEHLLALINNVLEMSKIEAGKSLSDIHAFDLYKLLHDLEMMFVTRAIAKGIKLESALASNVPQCIVSDENKLRQVLINLLSNALKFTEEGGITLRTDAQKTEDAIWLRIAIEDTGLGIGKEELEHLFTPFHQTLSGLRIQGGTGLGLAISNEFIRQMGGTIRVESAMGKGSTFIVHIPIQEADFNTLIQKRKKKSITGLAPGQKEYRILVVDDLETNRNLLTLLLEELGFRVSVAENGVVALHLFEEWHPDLILMDLKMPIMDGYEATEQIKALPGGEQTKIIALTASAFEENRQAILHKGADDYIRKPYKEEELFQKISSVLGVVFTYSDEGYEERTDHAFDLEEQHQVVQKLQRLPSEILNQMKTMALNAEKDPLLVMIQRIGIVDRELAATLEELIEKYEYESLSRLIHEALQPEP